MRSAPATRPAGQAKILLVDDNQDGILARRCVLEEVGYQILSARSGSDALTLVEKNQFDLVVTDFKMSPVNGLELIRELRARGFPKPIILLTGFAESVGLTAASTGADAVIQKSANEIVVLVRHVKRLLNVPRKPAASQAPRPRKTATRSSD